MLNFRECWERFRDFLSGFFFALLCFGAKVNRKTRAFANLNKTYKKVHRYTLANKQYNTFALLWFLFVFFNHCEVLVIQVACWSCLNVDDLLFSLFNWTEQLVIRHTTLKRSMLTARWRAKICLSLSFIKIRQKIYESGIYALFVFPLSGGIHKLRWLQGGEGDTHCAKIVVQTMYTLGNIVEAFDIGPLNTLRSCVIAF